jgi:hypothetical protein
MNDRKRQPLSQVPGQRALALSCRADHEDSLHRWQSRPRDRGTQVKPDEFLEHIEWAALLDHPVQYRRTAIAVRPRRRGRLCCMAT